MAQRAFTWLDDGPDQLDTQPVEQIKHLMLLAGSTNHQQ